MLRPHCLYPLEQTGSPYLQLPVVAFPFHVVRHCEGAIDGAIGAVGALPLLLQVRLEDHVSLSDRDTYIFLPKLVPWCQWLLLVFLWLLFFFSS